ncbi:7844_t:CDS:2 [Cetraspora pellucida]|uniref:7844_t:CDS:1 n=1 Tax=Cetraspora pellucida TaxID=1433469 RepID=A0A9N9GAT0_9GLOM|nr:7844_t:CDS:2 [Cetraspora pellucida]
MQLNPLDIIQSDAEDEIQILLLHLAMLMLATILRNKSNALSKQEGEKLFKLCLTTEKQD